MSTVTVSPKFQVVIPKIIRETMHIQPGQKLEVISLDNRIEFVPIRSMQEMRGFLRGLDSTFSREEDDRI